MELKARRPLRFRVIGKGVEKGSVLNIDTGLVVGNERRMPRKLRVEYPGAIYHVMNRGDRREPIFKDDEDRKLFLGIDASV